MTDDITDWTGDIHEGDAADVLSDMPADSVHFAMTSPPYYGLRDYDAEGQIGQERTLDGYIANLVDVARGIRRVLRDDGSFWLNLGDSFAGNGGGGEGSPLGRKNKMLVPYRVAIALQRDGWIVRNDVTWVKPNPMPSPVKDRLNTTTERVFHLTPDPDYWYNLDAIREPHKSNSVKRTGWRFGDQYGPDETGREPHTGFDGSALHPSGKNPGDVFEVTTRPFPDAHFAVYPPELCVKPIKASAPPKVCAECGAPWTLEIEREEKGANSGDRPDPRRDCGGAELALPPQNDWKVSDVESQEWVQECDCETDETRGGVVLDPFAGSGTTLKVAKEHGRRFVGVELNPEYVAMAQKRVGIDVDDPSALQGIDDQQLSLTDAPADGGRGD